VALQDGPRFVPVNTWSHKVEGRTLHLLRQQGQVWQVVHCSEFHFGSIASGIPRLDASPHDQEVGLLLRAFNQENSQESWNCGKQKPIRRAVNRLKRPRQTHASIRGRVRRVQGHDWGASLTIYWGWWRWPFCRSQTWLSPQAHRNELGRWS